MVAQSAHADSVVRKAEDWLHKHFQEPRAVAGVVAECGIPERSLKRRFAAATGSTVIGYVQSLRIEQAKRLHSTKSRRRLAMRTRRSSASCSSGARASRQEIIAGCFARFTTRRR